MGDVERVREKLEEYGIEVYTDYSITDSEYVFMVEKISFHAETRPDIASTYTLIMKEIEDMKELEIMESFVVDEGNKFVSGEKAFDLVQRNIIQKVTHEIVKESSYSEMLMTNKCFHC